MKKIFGILLIVIIVLGFTLKFGIDYYLSSRFKTDVENFLQSSVNTRVKLDGLSTNIFSKLSANGIKIWEPASEENVFLTVGSLNFVYEIGELFKKKLVISHIDVRNILVNIVRFSNGKFNLEKFQNLVYDFSIFPSNKIYAAESVKPPDQFVNVNKVNVSNMVVAYNDEKVNVKSKTGSINADAVISPLKVDVTGKLFNNEDVKFNLHEKDGVLAGDFSLLNIDAIKYQPFFNEYIAGYDIKINKAFLDAQGVFSKKGEHVNYSVDIIIKSMDILYAGINFRVNNQKFSVVDNNINLKNFTLDLAINNVKVSTVRLSGEFKDFNELKANFTAELFEADILKLFEVLKQEMKIEEKGKINGNIDMNLQKKTLKMSVDGNVPSINYAFLTEDKKKIQFLAKNLKIKSTMENMVFDITASGFIFKGSFNVSSKMTFEDVLKMQADFTAKNLSALDFLKLNNMDKIPVQGEIHGDFKLTGQNFDMKTFEGNGSLTLTKAFFETMGIEKLFLKSSSETLRNLPMKDIKAKVKLKDEKFSFGDIEGIGDEFNFFGGGYIDTEANMNFSLNFSPQLEFLKKNDIDKYLTVDDKINIQLLGSAFSPQFKTNIDDIYKEKIEAELKEKVLDKIEEKGKELLKKLFK